MVKSISIAPLNLTFDGSIKTSQQQLTVKNTGNELVTFSNVSDDLNELTVSTLSTLAPEKVYDGINFTVDASNTVPPKVKMIDETKGVACYDGYTALDFQYIFFTVDSVGQIAKLTERSLAGKSIATVLPLNSSYAFVIYYDAGSVKGAIYEINVDELVNPGTPTIITASGSASFEMDAFILDSDTGRILVGYELISGSYAIGINVVDCDTSTKTVTVYSGQIIQGPGAGSQLPRFDMYSSELGLVSFYSSFGPDQAFVCAFRISGTTISITNIQTAGNSYVPNYNRHATFINDSTIIICFSELSNDAKYSIINLSGLTLSLLTSAASISDNPLGMHTVFLYDENKIALLYGRNIKRYLFDGVTNTISLIDTINLVSTFVTSTTEFYVANLTFPFITGKNVFVASTATDGVDIYSLWPAEQDNIDIDFKSFGKPNNGTITIESDATSSPDEIPVTISMSIKEIDEYDYITPCPVRWDWLSYNFYGSFDYVEQLIEANKHIPYYWRKAVFLPTGTNLIIPTIEV